MAEILNGNDGNTRHTHTTTTADRSGYMTAHEVHDLAQPLIIHSTEFVEVSVETSSRRVVTVSNRLPVEMIFQNGEWLVRETVGGMVTGVSPVMRKTDGRWIGYAGQNLNSPGLEALATTSMGSYIAISPDPNEYKTYYGEIANRVLWGVFHNSRGRYIHIGPNYQKDYADFEHVNTEFANATIANSTPNDLIMAHDYHLIPLAAKLRELWGSNRKHNPLAFFLHIPFPEIDSLALLPNAETVVRQMLTYDYVGFHTHDYVQKFAKAVRYFVPEATVFKYMEYDPELSRDQTKTAIQFGERTIKIGAHPISIDADAIETNLDTYIEEGRRLRKLLNAEGKILFSDAGRADHTKGTHETLKAFDMFLNLHPELKGSVSFALVLQPSREDLPEYQAYNQITRELIAQINVNHGVNGEPVIHHIKGLPRESLMGLLTTTDIALIAPPADGMNLVAKEYLVAGPEDGILILGKNVGAAQELYESALLVNPVETIAYAGIIYEAVRMKKHAKEECVKRKTHGKNIIRQYDAIIWGDSLISAAYSSYTD